ncbi:ATP-binding protein [Cohaesibacter sp. ES.047]|uniref:sensor histidine kinase n=1 Tax=Cohaesibacter sp. ES.047 TaxID=1798205 RepID=UPI0015606645|nr:ATP-binding protein [Cohaesibacter sp. ES.047]
MNIYEEKDINISDSIFTPFLAMAIGLVLCTSIFVGFLQYWQNQETNISRESERLDFAVQQAARDLKIATDDAKRNVRMLAGTPPIQGILNARAESGSEQIANIKEAVWKDRLAQIFLSLAESNPDLLQIRLIDKTGMELVRINNGQGNPTRVKGNGLQDKSTRAYFAATLADLQDRVRFFGIDLNRERNEIETPHVAVMRVASKVYGRDAELLGVIVINTNMSRVIKRLTNVMEREKIFLMTDKTGAYLSHPDETKTFGRDLGTPYRLQKEYPAIGQLLQGAAHSAKGQSWSVQTDDYLARVARLHLSEELQHHSILIAAVAPMSLLMEQSIVMRDQIIVITLMLVVVATIIASILTRYMASPLQLLTKATSNLSMGAPLESLKVEGRKRRDEVGILLRSVYQMAASLEEKQERIKAILATAENPILSINKRGIIKDVNQATSSLFGYDREEMIGKNVSMLMNAYDRERHNDYLRRFASGGKPNIIGVGREVTAVRKDGSSVQVHLAVSKLRVKGETYYTGIMTDLTELQKVQTMKSEFVSKVSHELRTPLTSIKGSLGLVRSIMPGDLPEQPRKMLDIAYDNCDRLTHLVNDILDMEKIEAGKLTYDVEPIRIVDLLERNIRENRAYGRQYGVSLKLECHSQNLVVSADPYRIEQVMTNLISNAVKHSPDGGEVRIAAEREKDRLHISVTDHGKGIPAAFQEQVFGKFAQADNSGNRRTGGSGLGLAISKEIVRAHGGDISFETEEGVGTTFHVRLKVAETSALEIPEEQDTTTEPLRGIA